ncbi:MAG TPA: lipid II flippase MurJ [Candidatus Paceibacterota bacterium]|nr:lipid II flippase MurJ [Candidatus Paceibacterota bacterium]
MVNRIITFLNKEFRGVNEAALLLGGFAFLSQILGLIRDRTLAHVVGVGPVLDIYYAAFRIPDFLYLSIASLASITVLMPFLVDKISNDNNATLKARTFMSNIFSAYLIFMLIASLIIAMLMPKILSYLAPGFNDHQLTLLITTSRIMLLSPILIGLSNLIGTVTQLFRNFLIFSLSPVFYNVGILIGVIFIYPKFGVYGLSIGVIIGAFMHFIIQVPIVVKHNLFPKFTFKINWHEILNIVKLSAPRTLALSCNSLAFIFLIAMASTLKSGSISLFTFAYNLQSVPVGIIGISYSVAAFPILVKSFSMKDMDNFLEQINFAARQIIFWSLPLISLFIVLRAQIVRVILGSTSFSWFDTRLTAASIALFVVSLVSQGLVLLFVRGYYASGNTKKPLIINVFSSVMVIVFAKLLIYVFQNYPQVLNQIEVILRVKDVPGTIMLALPLAYAMGSILNFVLIWILFKKDFFYDKKTNLSSIFLESAVGAVSMGLVSYISLGLFDNVFDINTGVGIFLQGFLSGIIGIVVGIGVLIIIKNKELMDVFNALKNKFWRNRVVVPEQTDL